MSDPMADRMYVVTSGDYSDYRVLCGCPSEDDAKRLAARITASGGQYHDEARVESLPLLAGDAPQVEILVMSTTLWDDGRETDLRSDYRVTWPFGWDGDVGPVKWRWVRAPMHNGKGGRLDVEGTDHERVRKVYGDQRAMLISDDAYRARREIDRTLR